MKLPRKIGFYVVLLTVGIVGCVDDYPLIVRDYLAMENELLDAAMKVVDEDSAKDFMKFKEDLLKAKKEKLTKRFEAWKANLDKKADKEFEDFVIKRAEFVGREGEPDISAFAGFGRAGVYYRVTREVWAMGRARGREIRRLQYAVSDLTHRKILELKAMGEKNPVVNAPQEWPTLYKLPEDLLKYWEAASPASGGSKTGPNVPSGPGGGPPGGPGGAAGMIVPGVGK